MKVILATCAVLFACVVQADRRGLFLSKKSAAAGGGPSFPANCVAYWKMDEGTPTFVDFFTGNDLTTSGFDPSSRAGIINNCGDYTPGNFDFVTLNDTADTSIGANVDYSFSVWINSDTFAAGHAVFGKDSGGVDGYNLTTDATSHFVWTVYSTGSHVFTSTATLSTATWYHIVVTYDQSNIRLYLNGSLDGSPQANTADVADEGQVFEVGRSQGSGLYWDGGIDELGIWKRVLSLGEVQDLYNSGAGLQP